MININALNNVNNDKFLFFFAEENCTWTGSPWASWEGCNMTEGNCGNGFRFRKRKHCICGGQDVQTDETICGIAPTQIQSCYILCNGVYILTHFTPVLQFQSP